MFRLYNSHPQANVEHCLGTYSAHAIGSHIVYILVIYVHKIVHNVVKLALQCSVYYRFRNTLTLQQCKEWKATHTTIPLYLIEHIGMALIKESGNRLLAYIDVLFILNESLNKFLDIKLNELNIINTCL